LKIDHASVCSGNAAEDGGEIFNKELTATRCQLAVSYLLEMDLTAEYAGRDVMVRGKIV
jgi:hypothetical protein